MVCALPHGGTANSVDLEVLAEIGRYMEHAVFDSSAGLLEVLHATRRKKFR